MTDGYQVYHTVEKGREDLKIAGCWSHARRRFDEAVKALPKDKQKSFLASGGSLQPKNLDAGRCEIFSVNSDLL